MSKSGSSLYENKKKKCSKIRKPRLTFKNGQICKKNFGWIQGILECDSP